MRAQKYNYFYHPLSSIEKNLNLRDNYFDSVRICKFIIKAVIFLGFFISEPQETFSQTLKDAVEYRRGSPIVKLHSTSAPGYCESYGGSTLFESISNVNVVEKPGNLLDITVDVYIANPTGCKSGEPCGVYDNSPEYVNVWIDWNGNKIWEPDEKVLNADLTGYKNINYSGTMTAKGTVEIPPNAVKPAWLRANLGYYYDPDDPCEEYWSYGNVVDQEVLWNMKVKQISATLNIDIQDVPNPVWEADYSENGQTLNVVSNTPIAAGMKNGWFTLPVELVSFPASLGDNSRTNCNWEITGTGINGLAGITGKKGVISVSLPQKIGMYELKLKFSFKNNLNNTIGEQIISLPLWVSYNKPQLAGIKKIWLQKAIEWTEGTLMGSNIEDELAAKIMDGIYSKSGWQYYSYNFLWSKLVEGIETQGANCNVVANVWLNLLKTLGVGDVSLVNHSGKVNDKGFMVIPGVKAFGNLPSANGDASKDYTFYPTYDRWVFDSHTFGKKGNTYYDPTFDITGTDKYFHVAHDILGTTGGIIYTNAGGPTLKKMSVQFLEGWPKYIYTYPSNKIEMEPVYKPLTGGAKFSGTFTESHNDLNNDGLYDQLTGLVGVEITNPGKYLVTGYLTQGGNYITSLPYYSSPVSWLESVGPQTGSTQVQVQFSGERIFSKSLNGPYTIELSITDSTGALTDSASFNTSPLNYQQFGEFPARLINITENAVDTSSDGFYDLIKTGYNINVSTAGLYSIQASLSHNGQLIFTGNQNAVLKTSSNQLNQSLDTKFISGLGVNGPYTLALQVLDSVGEQIAYREIQTAAYTANKFAPPAVKITGGNSDQGIDINSNGLFDTLQVAINIEAISGGKNSTMAWLMGANGENITWAESKMDIKAGSNAVNMNFPGIEINKSQIDGPYKIGYAVIRDSSNVLFYGSDLYTTQSYKTSQFEESVQIVTSTGNYSEDYIDADANGLIDTLVIEVEVVPRDSGNVVAYARLADPENETILWSSATEFLKESIPQKLQLKFDGRYIYGGLADGPYELKDLQIYHAGDPSQTIDIQEAYTTKFYKYTEFEKSGVITGIISDSSGTPVQNAFLIIQNVDNDYSNIKGKFNLVVLDTGYYDIKIEGPDTLNLSWSISLNGSFLSYGDSARIRVDENQIVNLDFKAPVTITDVNEKNNSKKIPEQFILSQNYPNPFNPGTTLSFVISRASLVTLKVYDILGRETATLVNEEKPAGSYEITWNAANLPSGVYFYRLQAGEFIQTRKMVLMK